MLDAEPRVRRSLILRFQLLRIFYRGTRSRVLAAYAGCEIGSTRARLLAVARREARALEREGLGFATAFGQLTLAIAAWSEGDREGAVHFLEAAERAFEQADLILGAAVTRWRRVEIIGGAEGKA